MVCDRMVARRLLSCGSGGRSSGDTPDAASLAAAVRLGLEQAGITVAA
jgi:hypothetical protein